MIASMPFRDSAHVRECAAAAKKGMAESDWLESFAGHPRVGRKAKGEKDRTEWQKGEQAGAENAPDSVLDEMDKLNDAYWKKFGFVFLINATGKSAEEMLGALKLRLNNDKAAEIKNAAEQESQITSIRIEKLLNELSGDAGEKMLKRRETNDSAAFRAGSAQAGSVVESKTWGGNRMRGALEWKYEAKDRQYWGGQNYHRFPTPKINGSHSLSGSTASGGTGSSSALPPAGVVKAPEREGVFFGGVFR